MDVNMKVAAVQMTSTEDVVHNCAVVKKLVAQAAAAGAKLVLLPEYWAIMGLYETDKLRVAQRNLHDELPQFMSTLAKDNHICLIGGTIPMQSPVEDKVWNTTLVYDAAGMLLAQYNKIHLFDFMGDAHIFKESRTVAVGHDVVTVETPAGKTGLSICYDLRFPELYRAMHDCRLIVLPAAFTETTGQAHWEILLRARAIENQCYVLASAQTGRHTNGRQTWGHSMLIDPWGRIVTELAEGEGTIVGELDQTYLEEVRQKLPALQHRQRSII